MAIKRKMMISELHSSLMSRAAVVYLLLHDTQG